MHDEAVAHQSFDLPKLCGFLLKEKTANLEKHESGLPTPLS
jgi:hypothetical protein